MNKNEALKHITSTLSGVPQSAPRQNTGAVIVYVFIALLALACGATGFAMIATGWLARLGL